MSQLVEVLKIGDKMRLSVQLLRDILEQPDSTTVVVVVKELHLQDDGTIDLWVEKSQKENQLDA